MINFQIEDFETFETFKTCFLLSSSSFKALKVKYLRQL